MESHVVRRVQGYLKQLRSKLPVPSLTPTDLYSIKTEHKIQIGSFNCRADVVLLKENLPLIWGIQTNDLIVIVECKAVGKTGDGVEQLQSYLCATDTRFGIFAANLSPTKWKYYENYGRNNFGLISREEFEAQVRLEENAAAAKEKEAKRQIEQAKKYHSQRVEKELVEQYKAKEIDLRADLDRQKANLHRERANLQTQRVDLDRQKANLQTQRVDLDRQKANLQPEAHQKGFNHGCLVGVITAIVVGVIIAIIASGG